MNQNQQQNQNSLFIYRRRMGFSQKHISRLLGFPDTAMVSRYERGLSMPPLDMALSLGIVLRVPVEFLFPNLYDGLRDRIRAHEERMSRPTQPTLFSYRN
jgi:transcriptional regulator with XRE-family HTH domain